MRDVNRLSRGFLVAVIGFLLSSRVVSAEMPPSAYAKMQDAAGEILQVVVLSVDGSFQWRTDNEIASHRTARVVCRCGARRAARAQRSPHHSPL